MRTFAEVAVGVIVAGLLASWIARRRGRERLSVATSILAHVLAQGTATAILFAVAVKLAQHGGVWIAFGVLLGIFALAISALVAVKIAVFLDVVAHGLPAE